MAEQEKLNVKFSGLYTSVNPFGDAPDGSAAVLDNCILRNPGIVEPRRGYYASAAHPDGNISRLTQFGGRVFAWGGNSGGLRDFTDGTGWSSQYGTYSPPDASNPIRAATAAQSLFFTTSSGVMALDKVGGTVRPAGIPMTGCWDSTTTVTPNAGGSAWLANGNSVAYVVVLCRYDANNHLIQSAPSQPLFYTNSTGNAIYLSNMFFAFDTATPATFAQLYRTFQTSGTPSGEYFLVQEHTITAGDISFKSLQFQPDITPDSSSGTIMLTVPLYTNAISGDGPGASNDLPPLARDLCAYNGRMLYANTTERHAVDLQLIGTAGLVSGTSTITISGKTYLLTGAQSISSSPQVHMTTAGSAAFNTQFTAQELSFCVTQVNNNGFGAGTLVFMEYLSGANDVPGIMRVVEKGVGGSAYTVSVGQDNQLCWSPDLSSHTYTLTSNNNRRPARLWWSNDGEPWGVNADSWADVGAEDQDILRIILVRSTVFIFKKDGLFALTGDAPPYTITPFDPSLVLYAPETAQVVDNKIFCLTNRGAVYVSEAGVSPAISSPIERDISTIQYNETQYTTVGFGVSYEDEGLYLLALPVSPGDTTTNQQYVFDASNPSWTRWLVSNAAHGIYNTASKQLMWAVGSTLWEERKAFAASDIQDPTLTGTTTGSSSSNQLTVTGAAMAAGDILNQGGVNARVVSVVGSTATLDAKYTFSNGSVTVYKAIPCTWQLLPITAGDPVFEKAWGSAFLSFKLADFESFNVGFNSNKVAAFSSVARTGPASTLFANPAANWLVRFEQPQGMGQSSTLGVKFTFAQAQSFWQAQGLMILYSPATAMAVR